MDILLTDIRRNSVLVILSEEKHENLRAIHGHCAHWHFKKCYVVNSIRGKSRESQGYPWTLGKPKSRWRYIIKMDLRLNMIRLAQDSDWWRALVSAVMNFWFHEVGQWDEQWHAGCIINRAGHVRSASQKTIMKEGGGTANRWLALVIRWRGESRRLGWIMLPRTMLPNHRSVSWKHLKPLTLILNAKP
jgi:hypothetical protein